MPVNERVKCRKCEAMILAATARRNRGYCGVCVKTRGVKYWVREVAEVLMVFGLLVAMPFIVIWFSCRDVWRRWRFPFDRQALRERIRAVHADKWVVRAYLHGVIDGYWDGTSEEKRVRRYPPRRVVAAGDGPGEDKQEQALRIVNPSRTHGMRDGARLRAGEIAVEEIPSYREVLVEIVRSRDELYREG
jgi:hypothetical protein